MTARLTGFLEAHPWCAWLISLLTAVKGVLSVMVEHADDAAKVFGVFATIFACIAGYYTMRIQRRTFKQGEVATPKVTEEERHGSGARPPRWRRWSRRSR